MYWQNKSGTNLLKGVENDPQNPILMPDWMIAHALSRSRIARTDFNRVVPTMLQEEQDRLTTLISDNPRCTSLITDPWSIADAEQRKWNASVPIRTVGPRGGKGAR